MQQTKVQTELPSAITSGESTDGSRRTVEYGSTQQQIRGSMLLFAGRPIALVLNLLTQVLTIRYLSKQDFGAFIFAFALAETAVVIALFGMDKAVARYAPMHLQNSEHQKLSATIAVSLMLVLGVGVTLAFLTLGLGWAMEGSELISPLSFALLTTLIFLAPIKAMESMQESLASVFAGSKLVFLHRAIQVPVLRLLAVLTVVAAGGSVYALAMSHVAFGVLSMLVYGFLVWRVLSRRGVFKQFSFRTLTSSFRELGAYSSTLFGSDLTLLIRSILVVVLLQVLHSTTSVADFRAILPIARLNELAVVSFSVLFIPIAARVFANNDPDELNDLYWQSAIWITVLTFPLFALSYLAAEPLALFLFGSEYSGTGNLLAILAFGFYFNSILGFNSRTLKVVGKMKQVLLTDLAAFVVAVVLYFVLIPQHGALGAAIAACVSTIVHALLKQFAVQRWTHVHWCEWRYGKVYLAVAVATVVLTTLRFTTDTDLPTSVGVVAVCWFGVLVLSREALAIDQMFPELSRFPILNQLLRAK